MIGIEVITMHLPTYNKDVAQNENALLESTEFYTIVKSTANIVACYSEWDFNLRKLKHNFCQHETLSCCTLVSLSQKVGTTLGEKTLLYTHHIKSIKTVIASLAQYIKGFLGENCCSLKEKAYQSKWWKYLR